jgi:hypothetical protein
LNVQEGHDIGGGGLKETLGQRASWLLMAGLAIVLLIPCFWQPHIEAGDLSSHVYNAWLAGQIQHGEIPGLTLAHPITNVLADWALQVLSGTFGADRAERVVVAAAVQLFFWGAFSLIAAIHRRRPWIVVPFLAMLAYGLIFHFGFLNFYLSVGLTCCWMALLWRPSLRRFYIAPPVAVLALFAHPLPLVWGVLTLAYVAVAERLNEKLRVLLLPTAFSVLILIQTGLTMLFPSRWSLDQLINLEGVLGIAGAEQFWLYGNKYLVVVAGVLVIWSALFLERLDHKGMFSDPIVQLWCLNIAGFVLLPFAIQFPGYQFALLYIPQRVSLFVAILFCAVVAGGRYGRGLTRLSTLLAAAFFTFVYLDVKALNRIEAQITALVSQLPPGQRVVMMLRDSGSSRLNGLVHIGDGACLGRCFDYGNYEPSTGQFRVRALGPNGAVASTRDIVREMELGEYIVTRAEAPLYSICPSTDPARPFLLKKLAAGEKTCVISIEATPQFF